MLPAPYMADPSPTLLRGGVGWEPLGRRADDGPSFFLGLDRLAQRRKFQRVSTDDFQAILEETSGQDLSDFFDFWVHGGRLPKVTLTYALVDAPDGKKTVEACVASDVPFGSFDVPVEVAHAICVGHEFYSLHTFMLISGGQAQIQSLEFWMVIAGWKSAITPAAPPRPAAAASGPTCGCRLR